MRGPWFGRRVALVGNQADRRQGRADRDRGKPPPPDCKRAARYARWPAQAATAVLAGAVRTRAAVRHGPAALPGIATAGRFARAFHAASTEGRRAPVAGGAPMRRSTSSPAK